MFLLLDISHLASTKFWHFHCSRNWLSHEVSVKMTKSHMQVSNVCASVCIGVQMWECRWNENMCADENASMSASVFTSLSCWLSISTSARALSIGNVWDNLTLLCICTCACYPQLLHPHLENFSAHLPSCTNT